METSGVMQQSVLKIERVGSRRGCLKSQPSQRPVTTVILRAFRITVSKGAHRLLSGRTALISQH
jgi:hypothetical protein